MRLIYTASWGGSSNISFKPLSRIMLLLLVTVGLAVANMFFPSGVVCVPLSDQGPHIAHGWGQVVRLRHLYAARPGLHLLISRDGQIHGSVDQTLYSKFSDLKYSPNKLQSIMLVGDMLAKCFILMNM